MSEEKEEKKEIGITELKSKVYSMPGSNKSGRDADNYTKTTRAIAEYAGRVYGHAVKTLILKEQEAVFVKPKYPKKDDEEAKAIWSKDYDWYKRKVENYDDHKAKVFTLVYGRCDKAVKNRVETDSGYEEAEEKSDVVALLKIIKTIVSDANEKKYPALQAAMAWKDLCRAFQKDNEELIDYYHRFVALVERVELEYGNIDPEGVAKKNPMYGAGKVDEAMHQAKQSVLACLFMDGANKKRFGAMMIKLSTDYTLDDGTKYPESVEDALQVLTLYEDSRGRKLKGKSEKDDVKPNLTFLHCWLCKKEGHKKADCPENNKDEEGKKKNFSGVQTRSIGWAD